MKNRGIRNGLLAAGYIAVVASALFYGNHFVPGPDTPFIPMAMLGLFVLSVATMGWLFVGQPVIEYVDGRKKEAVELFGWTLGTFGIMVIIFFFFLILIPNFV